MKAQWWSCCDKTAESRPDGGAGAREKETDRDESSPDCWDWCSRARSRDGRAGSRFGYLLILIGLLWLGGALGWVRAEIIWPLTLVTIGFWIAVFSRIRWKRDD